MSKFRTDLALEANELAGKQGKEAGKLSGVRSAERNREGMEITEVEVLDENGSKELEKPIGKYVTLQLTQSQLHSENFAEVVQVISDEIKNLMPDIENPTVLVVGLGNRFVTPDAVGPRTVEQIMVTRHLLERMPQHFNGLNSVCAVSPGVLGITGMESCEMVFGICQNVKPDAVIAVDALASRKLSRLCSTIQLTDTGIVPGSGVGNSRAALTYETLGIPVLAAGIPTVVDAATLASDLIYEAGGGQTDSSVFDSVGGDMIVTPKDIDRRIQEVAKILGYAINMALHPVSVEDISIFLS
jgi:spore protease